MIHTADSGAVTDYYRPSTSWPRGDSYPARSGRGESGRVGTGCQGVAPAGCARDRDRGRRPRGFLRHDQTGLLPGRNPVAV